MTRSLTVLMTADTVGGVWSYALRLCRSLPEIRFVLATMGPRPARCQREEVRCLKNVMLAESDFSLEWMANREADFGESCAWLRHLTEQQRADVVHVNGYAHAGLGTDRPVLIVAHSDVCSWWAAVHNSETSREWEGYRTRVVDGLAAAWRIVAPTAAVLRDLEHHYLKLSGTAQVIPNGIDLAACAPFIKRPVVMAAGRLWDAAKNLATLAAAAPQLAWPVEIAGDVEHPDGGIANLTNVRLLGKLTSPEMVSRLERASIFAAPARYEPFGLAILEAAAARCALVLGDIPSLRENWDGAAMFVDPDDPGAICSAISSLIADAGERGRLQIMARSRARHFTLHGMARGYAAVYREVSRDADCAGAT